MQRGLYPVFGKHLEFGEFTLFIVRQFTRVNSLMSQINIISYENWVSITTPHLRLFNQWSLDIFL